jgi:hypothetical protein
MTTNEFAEAKLQPSKPRQCMHWNSDGIRCRSYARHNEYTCFHHRITEEPSIPVIANDPFTLPPLNTREGVQEALTAVATHLAGKTIDDRRANLLLYTIQLASYQLPRPIQMSPEFLAPENQTLDAPGEAEASQEPPPLPQPPREYTDSERYYLFMRAMKREEPSSPRPESLSQQDVDAYLTFYTARNAAEEAAEAAARSRKRKNTSATLPGLQAVGGWPTPDHTPKTGAPPLALEMWDSRHESTLDLDSDISTRRSLLPDSSVSLSTVLSPQDCNAHMYLRL